MADSCLFCRILEKQIPAKVVYEDPECIAFEDINPQAPTHVLVIPRKHIPTVSDLTAEDRALVGQLFIAAAKIVQQRGQAQAGYRVVMNTNAHAGQTVFHIHLHVLAGRALGWPPG